MDREHLLQIGDVAERVGLSLRTVRYYEEQGLLTPETRTSGGFRLFSEEQVRRLELIKQMKPIGFSIHEMRELLDARDELRSPASGKQERAAARESLAAYAEDAAARSEKLRNAAHPGRRPSRRATPRSGRLSHVGHTPGLRMGLVRRRATGPSPAPEDRPGWLVGRRQPRSDSGTRTTDLLRGRLTSPSH